MKNITSLILLIAFSIGLLPASARNVMFNLTPGSAAELRRMNYQTYDDDVVAVLTPGSTPLDLSDDYYYLYPAQNRVLEYVRDSSQKNLTIDNNGSVRITVNANVSPYFTVSTSLAPVVMSTSIYVYKGSSAVLYHYNSLTEAYERHSTLLQASSNTVELVEGESYLIAPGPEHTIVSILDSHGNALPVIDTPVGPGVVIEAAEGKLSSAYNVTTDGPEPVDPWMKPFYIDIDNPDLVTVFITPEYVEMENLKPGRNLYYFDTRRGDMGLWVVTKNGRDLCSAKLDGRDQDVNNAALIYFSENSEIEIRAEFPADLFHTYTLAYTEEDGFWTRVAVDGKDYTPADGRITVQAGSLVQLWNSDAAIWNVTSITLPSGRVLRGYMDEPYPMDPETPVEFFATYADSDITVKAHRYGDANVTFNISNSKYVKLLTGNLTDLTERTGLTDGANNLHDNEANFQSVRIMLRDPEIGFIKSVTYKTSASAPRQVATYSFDLGYYSIANLREGAVVDITAVDEPGTFNIGVTVNSPDDILLYSDASLSEKSRITTYIHAGYNTVPFPENKQNLYVVPATSDSFLRSVLYQATENDTPFEAGERADGVRYISNVRAGGLVTVTAGHHEELLNTCVVYLDYATDVSLTSPDSRQVPLEPGYNIVSFNEDENNSVLRTGFTLAGPRSGNFTAFKNDNRITTDAGAHQAQVRLAQDDVIKLYVINPTPALTNMKIETEGVELATLTKDIIVSADPASESLRVLPGTCISFTLAGVDADTKVTAVYNSTVLLPDDDGIYTFTTADTPATLSVSAENAAIEQIGNDFSDAPILYFDLQGRRIDNPAPGLYLMRQGDVTTKVIVR